MAVPTPRFGIWAQVSGATGSLFHPDEAPDATWERNKRLVLEAEALGYDSTLVAQQFQPFEAEMRRFAHEVRPRVERLFAQAA